VQSGNSREFLVDQGTRLFKMCKILKEQVTQYLY